MKNSKSMIQDRQNGILEYLKKNNSADVNHLAALFHVTPMTVRRDLDALESQGSVRRFFGGVEYLSGPCRIPILFPSGNPPSPGRRRP